MKDRSLAGAKERDRAEQIARIIAADPDITAEQAEIVANQVAKAIKRFLKEHKTKPVDPFAKAGFDQRGEI